MSKDALADWDATAANNTDVGGISIAEGMAVGDVNNAMREIMAQMATWYAGHAWDGTAKDVPGDNVNTIIEGGVYNYTSTDTGAPGANAGVLLHLQRTTDRAVQIAAPCTSVAVGKVYWREISGAGRSDWREIYSIPTNAAGMLTVNSVGIVVGTETSTIDFEENTVGVSLSANGNVSMSRDTGPPLRVKRGTGNTLVEWWAGTVNVGSVTSNSGVVTYGSFCGSHWSQFKGLARPDILRGTILETIDVMCEWDGKPDATLPQVRVATAKSRSVYGVFSHWDEETRDLHVAALGTIPVRMAPGSTPRRGDLIESDANGLGVVQDDEIVRSSTVAKVIANARGERYPDGSFLIPCSIHCG